MSNKLFNLTIKKDSLISNVDGIKLRGASDKEVPSIGIFTTQQSVITFAVAPTIVNLVWRVLGTVFSTLEGSKLVPLILSLLIGMLIYFQSEMGSSKKERIIGFAYALVNSFAIAATTLGISTLKV